MNKQIDKVAKFDISSFEFKEIIDEMTALMLVKVCTSGDNLHDFPFTDEALKEAAERSLRGKPIVAKFNKWQGDFGTHDPLEVAIGYFVENQQFKYVKNVDNTTSLFAYAVLWKMYASDEYNAFISKKENGEEAVKGVSMEIKINLWGEQGSWNGDYNKKEIKKFSFKGVTIVGDRYNPASPGANTEMVSFVKAKKKEIEKYFTVNADKINNNEDSHSFLEKYYSELGLSTKNFAKKEGEQMPDTEKEEVFEAKTEDVATENTEAEMAVEVEVETKTEDGEKAEESIVEVEKVEEEETESEDFKAKYEEMAVKVAELEACNGVYMAENESLKAYKSEKEESEKTFTIEETILKFAEILPKEVIEEYRNRIKDVAFSETTAFCNEIKARIVDFVDIKKDGAVNRMGIPLPPTAKKEKSNILY